MFIADERPGPCAQVRVSLRWSQRGKGRPCPKINLSLTALARGTDAIWHRVHGSYVQPLPCAGSPSGSPKGYRQVPIRTLTRPAVNAHLLLACYLSIILPRLYPRERALPVALSAIDNPACISCQEQMNQRPARPYRGGPVRAQASHPRPRAGPHDGHPEWHTARNYSNPVGRGRLRHAADLHIRQSCRVIGANHLGRVRRCAGACALSWSSMEEKRTHLR
jgi:hypothetical protein